MDRSRAFRVLALAGACLFGAPVVAQEAAPEPALSFGTKARQGPALYGYLLLGGQAKPEYLGSAELGFGPSVSIEPRYLRLFGLEFGSPDFPDHPGDRDLGFSVTGSFRFVERRETSDFDELDGLDDIDETLEVGVGLRYTGENAEGFANLRYGIGGGDGWVGELGANYVARPGDRWTFRAGPRVRFGSDNYNDTFFGVSSAEAARSGYNAYDPDAGLVSAGVELTASYRLGAKWWLEGGARWDRFQGDAADSPIVRQGSDDQTRIRIGLRRAFILEF